ncbi:MAG: Maf family protein [Candidatus Tyrphobacter sp.]
MLASASPRRARLLQSVGLHVIAVPSGYPEPPDETATPGLLAAHHARAKLDAVRARFADHVVVAADTVVDLDGAALGKPRDAAEAASMLARLSGRSHVVHTAYAVATPHGGVALERLSSTTVRFYPLTRSEIDAYVATGDPLDKAGAYGIQGRAAALVCGIDGDYFTVVGFPLGDFIREIERLGFTLSSAK